MGSCLRWSSSIDLRESQGLFACSRKPYTGRLDCGKAWEVLFEENSKRASLHLLNSETDGKRIFTEGKNRGRGRRLWRWRYKNNRLQKPGQMRRHRSVMRGIAMQLKVHAQPEEKEACWCSTTISWCCFRNVEGSWRMLWGRQLVKQRLLDFLKWLCNDEKMS